MNLFLQNQLPEIGVCVSSGEVVFFTGIKALQEMLHMPSNWQEGCCLCLAQPADRAESYVNQLTAIAIS